MANLLYLVHRFPYPPNKGDKVRSYHLLRHLAERHRVHLGTLVDDPADLAHLDAVRPLCASLYAGRLHPRLARLRSLGGLLHRRPLTLDYYRDAGLQRWVGDTVAREAIDATVVFSSAMAQYAPPADAVPLLVDFVDVDSAKWTDYAPKHRWPMSWVYRREGARLLDYERTVAQAAQRSFFVTDNEVALFRSRAPECAQRVEAIGNGVDADFFAPDARRPSPFGDRPAVVFTGAMDYWPNVDAVRWFVQGMLPALLERWPALRFFIVGRSPTPEVQALASPQVVVTGTVDDVRPYLQHASVVVAPLRVARGIQNKILEAMAMARPVVAATSCVDAMDVAPGDEVLAAADEAGYIAEVDACLRAPDRAHAIGAAGRDCVVRRYSWPAHLGRIDAHLPAGAPGGTR